MASALMLGRTTYCTRKKCVEVTFWPQSTSQLTSDNWKSAGGVASVTRNGSAGVFLVTLDQPYRHLVSKQASVQLSTAADITAQFGDISNLGTGSNVTVIVRTQAGATPTDVAADANNSVSVKLEFEDADDLLGAP